MLESVPIASVGKIEVISVDISPKLAGKFPVANKSLVTFYKALLENYKPENIGIYGCSINGLLTAQFIAWLVRDESIPVPGAAGLFCMGAAEIKGDSMYYGSLIERRPPVKLSNLYPYYREIDNESSYIYPVKSPEVLAMFPPSLLISSTRDYVSSSIVYTHSQLVKLGVDADLHVWEGLRHGFFIDPDLPEPREVYEVVTRFFGKHLGNL